VGGDDETTGKAPHACLCFRPGCSTGDDLVALAGNKSRVTLQAVENQELIEPLRHEAHTRGKRFGGVAIPRLNDLDLFGRGQCRILRAYQTKRIERGHEPGIDGGRKIVGGENEPVKPTVQAHGAEAEAPLVALGDRGRCFQAVDFPRFDRRCLDPVDPVRTDGARDRGRFRDRDAVEAKRFAARFADADQRGRLIVEREAVGGLKGETEF